MSNKNDGGSAYPAEHQEDCNEEYPNGMSLRDYFAGQASEEDIKFIIKDTSFIVVNGITRELNRIEARYRFADAMLKERDK